MALYWALKFFTICAVTSLISCVNYTPMERVFIGDSTDSSVGVDEVTAKDFWAHFVLDFCQLQSVFQPCTACCYTQATAPDRLHCGQPNYHCVVTNSHCYLLGIYKHPAPCVCTIWLNYKQNTKSHQKSKFGKSPVPYYSNATASFNFLLTVYGDIELNPGPVKDPCGSCSRPVKCNQRSLLCEDCNNFWHLKCIPDISITQYNNLISSIVDWFCPYCVYKLPFSSCTDASFHELFGGDHELDFAFEYDTHLKAYPADFPTPSRTRNNSISGLLLNSRSIRSKQQDLQSFLELHPIDIVCVTETWLSPSDVLCLPGYSTIRRDRTTGRGGGIMALVKDSLLPTHLDYLNQNDIEVTFLSITLKRSKWLVGIVYRPPNSNTSFFEKLQDIFDNIQANLITGFEGLIVLGDFNINWSMESSSLTSLQELTTSIGLTQLVEEVTRSSSNPSSTGTVIDLIFTNRQEKFSSVETVSNPVSSDHHGVFFSIVANKTPPEPKIVRSFLQYNKGDFSHLETLLHLLPWSAFMDHTDPDASWETFMDLLDAAIHDSIPRKSSNRRISPWITPALKQLIKRKQTLFTKAKTSGNIKDWRNYKQIRNELKNKTKKEYSKYVNNLFAQPDNKRNFWKFVKDQRKSKCPPAFKATDTQLHKPADICEAFNKFFTSVLTPAETTTETAPVCDLPIPEMPPVTVSLGWLIKSLSNLNPHKAPGYDTIPPKVLKATASSIALPLMRLMNTSLSTGVLPTDWKRSQITPVFKAGSRTDIKNYRPVALTSIICKVLERAVADSVNSHITAHCLDNPQQHGFTSGKSCVTQLANTIHNWATILDKPKNPRIDVIFLDFSKAFDTMPHHILLNKLASNYNICGTSWTWIKSFLIGRQQRVAYRGCFSEWAPVTSGVPQGSVLGPLLFNLFIADISHNMTTNCILFADDTLLYQPIKSLDDELSLQSDLTGLQRWTELNGMQLNTSKTKVMHISRSRKLAVLPNYKLHGTSLTPTPTFKYLGVTINNSLNWNDHINTITSKANKTLGFIWQIAGGASPKALASLYRSLVLPVLEYGLPVWCPYTASNAAKLEKVQRRASRMCLKQRKREMSYEDRLRILNWMTLDSRRQKHTVSFTIKCLFNLVDCQSIKDNTTVNTRHLDTLTFNHHFARTLTLKNTPSHVFPRIWSHLPLHVKDSLLIDSFTCFNATLSAYFHEI